jgi:hypothetical protein
MCTEPQFKHHHPVVFQCLGCEAGLRACEDMVYAFPDKIQWHNVNLQSLTVAGAAWALFYVENKKRTYFPVSPCLK